jgi:hypothetical protein
MSKFSVVGGCPLPAETSGHGRQNSCVKIENFFSKKFIKVVYSEKRGM